MQSKTQKFSKRSLSQHLVFVLCILLPVPLLTTISAVQFFLGGEMPEAVTYLMNFTPAAIIFFICLTSLYYIRDEKNKRLTLSTLLDDAIESSMYGFLLYDHDENLYRANEEARKILPLITQQPNQLETIDGMVAYIFDHNCSVDTGLKQSLDKRLDTSILAQGVIFDFKEIISLEGRLYMVQVQNTRTGGVVVILTDITSLKEGQEDLQRLNRRNHELIQAMGATSNGIIVSDPKQEGNPIIFANNAMCSMLKVDHDDIIGRDWIYILEIQKNMEEADEISQAISHKRPVTLSWKSICDDTPKWYKLTLSPVFDDNGELDLFIGIQSDITDTKVQEARFYQAQKLEALGQLAGGVAHDFNNVLSIIEGYARMIEKLVEAGSKEEDYLGRIRQASGRGASITKQLLTFGRHKIVVEGVYDIGKLINDQEFLLRPLLDASINLLFTADKHVFVECAADSLTQVVMNLVINARDAMPDGGTIIVDTRKCEAFELPEIIPAEFRDREYACLSVLDTGVGMDAELVEKVFDPFFTTKEGGKGTGLGLSMVYGIVTQAKGYIDVQSYPGQGTTIRMYLPISDKGVIKEIHKSDDNKAGIRFEGYTAIVAEDEPDLLHVVSSMLEDIGMKVISANNGNEALLKQEDYDGEIDFLITDIVMPELDGLRLAELMESVRPGIRIMYMSGYPADGQMARVSLPENACFLAKPVDYEMLAQLMKQQLEMDGDGHGVNMRQWQSAII